MERRTIALLVHERPSVRSLFDVVASQAFCKRIWIRSPGQIGVEIWNEGSRPWALRTLAKIAGLSVNTVRYGLMRLAKLGLIRKVANRFGTVVQVLRFFQFKRKNRNADEDLIANQADGAMAMTHRGDTRVSKTDHHRVLSSTLSRSLEDLVDVPEAFEPLETVVRPGTETGQRVKEMLARITRRL
jgi:DNA-binding transcriptional regulator YhcF (GntR family)